MADITTNITSTTTDEAWELLKRNALGHLAVVINDEPEVFPVNYAVDGDSVIFRTAPGTKLFGVTVNPKVAFESESHTDTGAWSVIVKGTAEVEFSNEARSEADAAGLHPWVPAVKENVVRIHVDEITGRRFEFGPEEEVEPEGAA